MKTCNKFICVIIAIAMTFSLCACGKVGVDTPTDRMYTIQYTDGMGVHSIEVQCGELYSITSIPEKNGYEFIGLYDAEVGGTQYVNAGGSAVAAFTDSKNIVLYPQFKAKEYTLVLDYQGAAVTGSRSIKVAYDSEISELPLNLTLENKTFVGWYTQPNRQGIQVSDQYGVIPLKNIVNESIFDLSNPQGGIYLYAGFNNEEFTVTFYFTESGAPEEVKVEYGTPISQVQPTTRVDGKAVLTWSKKRNDTNKESIFNGNITSEMVLYAAELAPVIDFDSSGGNTVNSIVARVGDAISLPTPTRENYKFIGWQSTNGDMFNATSMPTESVKLTAKWQAMIVFDTNGGTEVTNISEPQGTRISLPITEKDGYIFAGWYTEKKEQYISPYMPIQSICLKAGWYKHNVKVFELVGTENKIVNSQSPTFKEDSYNSFDVYNAYYRQIKLSDLAINTPTKVKLSRDELTELNDYRTNRKSTQFVPLGFKLGACGGRVVIAFEHLCRKVFPKPLSLRTAARFVFPCRCLSSKSVLYCRRR